MIKAYDENDNEIEVYSAEELKAAETAAATAAETRMKGEFEPKVKTLETELGSARTALATRAGEFATFRKLSDEAVAKLDEAQRTIYENGLALQAEREKNTKADKERLDKQVDDAIRAKAGKDEKLYTKMKDMFGIIGIEATTPETIETKLKMVVGAIGMAEPDLIAALGSFSGGSFQPPAKKEEGEPTYADTEKGKNLMDEIGLKIPKKEDKK